jgi:catechol 2,3-dioxygenase-like lactoylglutathione lyase family enzyme
MKFRYTGIRVTNAKRSVEVYTTTMGMKENHRDTMKAGGIFVQLKSPDPEHELELNYYPPGTKYFERYVEGSELDHVAFWCDDVHRDYEQALAGEATSTIAPWSKSGYTLAFIRDPDGVQIELIGKTSSLVTSSWRMRARYLCIFTRSR